MRHEDPAVRGKRKEEIGLAVRAARHQAGMSVRELGGAMTPPRTKLAMRKIERGIVEPSVTMLEQIIAITQSRMNKTVDSESLSA